MILVVISLPIYVSCTVLLIFTLSWWVLPNLLEDLMLLITHLHRNYQEHCAGEYFNWTRLKRRNLTCIYILIEIYQNKIVSRGMAFLNLWLFKLRLGLCLEHCYASLCLSLCHTLDFVPLPFPCSQLMLRTLWKPGFKVSLEPIS